MRTALLREVVVLALDTLRSNKLRSGLTILGVVIGITAIVGMTSLIRGFDQSLRNSIRELGPNTMFVAKFSAISFVAGRDFQELLRRPNLTVEDAQAIEKLAPSELDYRHHQTGEDNADAHLKRTLMGHQVLLPVTAGKLDLGPWEQVFYAEFDGQRRKRVVVKVIGE